ncbi:glycoside hydrolase family 31 protein [Pontibacillus sp. ALD_SL1]|uniref:glycoside hydrolase family 31 protein n=1 Tax=Pontibacillus sp. ALD_SL1 TaxID=2777185 RepID=UPI001A9635A2|nr:glycoside hydrolase family 31 protein [Pontibacillus sp. ALD_SL1]QST00782.1 glycoside hydrolase family 31 protein [Pontibacillus sp. ALD_SL1]
MLEDTSFAIHPGQNQAMVNGSYRDVGTVQSIKKRDGGVTFICDGADIHLQFYRSDIVRVIMNQKGVSDLASTPAVVAALESVNVGVEETDERVLVKTDRLVVSVSKQQFRLSVLTPEGQVIVSEGDKGIGFKENGEVICYKKMEPEDRFYGFGEKSGFLDKRGESYTMWNTDVYAPHNPETDPLYQSIPYFMALRNGRAYGIFFDNPSKTTFDMKTEQEVYSFKGDSGKLDYYVFAGEGPKEVIEQYTHITGRMPLPPKWAIGYHQSRYSYESEEEVRALANTFKEKGIPLDVIYLDIHYMNEYRVFTFDKDRFPNPKKLVQDLKEEGIRIVPIVDPGVKKDPEYSTYQEGVRNDHFCKYLEGDLYFGDVWPGTSAFPDFTEERTQNWWGKMHEFYTELGIEGIWNDMNEPAVFNETKTMDTSVIHKNEGDPKTHRQLHNLYGLLMGKATYEGMERNLNGKRPFLLTRAGFAGVQRYASVWTGDNRSFWEHLQMSLPMCMNLGLSGVAFTGPDVGGFAHDSNGELLARWTQVGAFTPYFRNHSAIGTLYQEPWQFGEEYEAIIKRYIELRYEWLPQLYSLFHEAHSKGLPVMRPLMLEYPMDAKTYALHDQFMIGDNTLIAPIMQPEVTDRAVYFPEGEWVDYFSGKVYQGGTAHLVHAELDTLPLFIKKGTLIAQSPKQQRAITDQKELELHVYAHINGSYNTQVYDDDGETTDYRSGESVKLNVSIQCEDRQLAISCHNEMEWPLPYKQCSFIFHGLEEGQEVLVNGERQSGVWTDRGLRVEVTI